MMRSNLPNKILGIVFATVLIFCGCSGFTSDPPIAGTTDDSGVNLQKEFAMARQYALGSYEITEHSESSATGVISISLVQESGCVKQGETYQWVDDLNRVTQFAGGLFRYSFAGDTLTLTALNEEPDYYGNVTVLKFVGGEPGKLQGIWLQLSRSAYTVYWNFGEGSIEIRVLEKENFNYMQSLFMWMFYESLEDSSMDIYADLIYDEHAVDPGRYGVAILKQDNRSETFTYKGVTYELKIDSVHSFDDYLSLTLSNGAAKCHLEYFSTLNVTPAVCKAENADGLHYSDATPDVMTRYSWGNEKEFGECVNQLIAAGESATTESSSSKFAKEFSAAHDFMPVYYSAEPSGTNAGTLVWDFGLEGRCLKEGEGVKWVDGWYSNRQDTAQYNFSGDTLFIHDILGSTDVLIGGTSGLLDGVWKLVGDSYVNVYVKFEKEKITFAYDMNPDYDYMNSEFFARLHSLLASGSGSLTFEEEFYEPEDELENGVTIVNHTNTSETVTINGKTYEITLNHAHMLWQDVSVTVKSGDMVCSGRKAQIEQISQEQCSVENMDYLDDYGLVSMVYIIDEEKSFSQCLEQMVSR
ncbi:hypothetical protein [Fibrobacter sp. HC4]|uniref:hypothetical protein n=1 Tax=Fibrobacter sp. HC4 TaxID=3239812 RepID=UPI0020194D26|nr:hypothetical protein [Fibrobacter succinogenes]